MILRIRQHSCTLFVLIAIITGLGILHVALRLFAVQQLPEIRPIRQISPINGRPFDTLRRSV